jgi:hypothetical protein
MDQSYLVGGIPTPLKNMSSSVGLLFPIYGKIKIFQTTNQFSTYRTFRHSRKQCRVHGFSMVFPYGFPGMPDTDADHILPALVLVAGVKVFNFLGEGDLRRSASKVAIIRTAVSLNRCYPL